MALMIMCGTEMIRINTSNNKLEYSRDGGRNWNTRYSGSYCGTFYDLMIFGNELLCCCSKGVYYSRDEGRNWNSRYTGSYCGVFRQLSSDGTNLLASTDKGLYYSRDNGRNWNRR